MINCRAGRKTAIICCLVTLSLGLVLDRAEASVSFSVQNSGSNCVTASPSIIIREGAGGNYDKVASVPYGEQVRITNSAGGYSEITTNGGINGWASTSFLGVCENVISDDRLRCGMSWPSLDIHSQAQLHWRKSRGFTLKQLSDIHRQRAHQLLSPQFSHQHTSQLMVACSLPGLLGSRNLMFTQSIRDHK